MEALGVDDPALDAEVVALGVQGFRDLGLTDFELLLTSLGDTTCRPQYRELLVEFLAKLDLDEDTRRRAEINPLRVLDDKRPEVQAQLDDAPLMVDHLSDSTQGALRRRPPAPHRPRGDLDRGAEAGARAGLLHEDHLRVRAQRARARSRRSAAAAATTGCRRRSAARTSRASATPSGSTARCWRSRPRGSTSARRPGVQAFVVPLGAEAKRLAVRLVGQLRRGRVAADTVYGDRGLKGAMKAADRSGASHVVVVGDRDLAEGVGQLKDMRTGEQRPVPVGELFETLRATCGRE